MRLIGVIFCSLVGNILAESLPILGKDSWAETYHGYEYRKMDVLWKKNGDILLFSKEKKERVSEAHAIVVKVKIEYKKLGTSDWVRRTIQPDGFTWSSPANLQQEKVTVTGTVTGDVKFQIHLQHTKEGVEISSDFVQPLDRTKAAYRLTLVSEMPDMYHFSHSEKKSDIYAKTKRDRLKIIPVNEDLIREKKYPTNTYIELERYEEAGIEAVELEASRYEKNKIIWSLVDPKLGMLVITPKSRVLGFHKGFYVSAILESQSGKILNKGIRIHIK